MFKGAWAIQAPGVFKRIPTKYASFAKYKKQEAYLIGVGAFLFGMFATCLVAHFHQADVQGAFFSCLLWQGGSTALSLLGSFFV